MHAITLEFLKDYLKESKKALDIGTGSGWMTVAIAKLMEVPDSIIYGMDHFNGVLKYAKKNI